MEDCIIDTHDTTANATRNNFKVMLPSTSALHGDETSHCFERIATLDLLPSSIFAFKAWQTTLQTSLRLESNPVQIYLRGVPSCISLPACRSPLTKLL